jgi:hypothetical protein
MLPYIATAPSLARLEGGAYDRWRPTNHNALRTKREVWMPQDMLRLFAGPAWASEGAFESSRRAEQRRDDCEAMLLQFVLGDEMTVGIRDARSDFKALSPRAGQPWLAWEMRPLRHRPHTRLLGVFASPRDFVVGICRAKASWQSTADQNRDAQACAVRLRMDLRNTVLAFDRPPNAACLGGRAEGWRDED